MKSEKLIAFIEKHSQTSDAEIAIETPEGDIVDFSGDWYKSDGRTVLMLKEFDDDNG